jgi:hypothetical protein
MKWEDKPEWRVVVDFEGGCHGLFEGTIIIIRLERLRKIRETPVRKGDI